MLHGRGLLTDSAGGFSVLNNKLYILGGFNINVGMVDTIWELTPSPPSWVQKSAHLPTALGYIPTATLGTLNRYRWRQHLGPVRPFTIVISRLLMTQ